jgi:hypothetical protein
VKTLAQHEQVNVLQRIMYDDLFMQMLLDWNQLAWAVEFPSGDYQEIKLNLSAQCPRRLVLRRVFERPVCEAVGSGGAHAFRVRGGGAAEHAAGRARARAGRRSLRSISTGAVSA